MNTLQNFQALVVKSRILAKLFWRNGAWKVSDYRWPPATNSSQNSLTSSVIGAGSFQNPTQAGCGS